MRQVCQFSKNGYLSAHLNKLKRLLFAGLQFARHLYSRLHHLLPYLCYSHVRLNHDQLNREEAIASIITLIPPTRVVLVSSHPRPQLRWHGTRHPVRIGYIDYNWKHLLRMERL
jgi:hypothetical protein